LDKYLASSRHSEILQGLHSILSCLFGYPHPVVPPCLDALHHCQIFGVCRVVFSKHSFFAVQCLESLLIQPARELVMLLTTWEYSNLSLKVENCFSMALNCSSAIRFFSTVDSCQRNRTRKCETALETHALLRFSRQLLPHHRLHYPRCLPRHF
jgi:hypothetical protein